MTPTLPFSPGDMEVLAGPGTAYFRRELHQVLISLRSVFEQASRQGLSMELQEAYDDLRCWLFAHQAGVRKVLCRREAGSSISTWSLEGIHADRLFRLVAAGGLDVEAGSQAGTWRPVLNMLIREAAGERASHRGKP